MERAQDISVFNQLLDELQDRVIREEHPVSTSNIRKWKGEDILIFQDELRRKTGSTVSEKWFYTYVRKDSEKLPRIDILHLLSQYAGYDNWHDFKQKHHQNSTLQLAPDPHKKSFPAKIVLVSSLAILAILVLIWAIFPFSSTHQICIQDHDLRLPITERPLHITILNNKERLQLGIDSSGCFKWKTAANNLRFEVRSPYYKTDTFYLNLNRQNTHKVDLKTDDYALMLYYYSNGKSKDWQKRKSQLEEIIDDQAIIMEVLPYQIGINLYEKSEFINKLTTPTRSLQRMEIISTQYQNERIVKLKFRQNDSL
ncbi:hypothetical protein [Nonlabens xiamenensis]|uniref:hypothetical protein n=1 Tax=Nonlabens xiamenensis TaxID=2341043 RepID=UPI000F607092|nr:hypothetical protein [Nonlabens xiamenensis]